MTLERLVTDHLTDQILDQRLRPGEHIVAENLARELGVSRLPVRAALRNLAGRGLVELRPHRGAFVTRVDGPDLLAETVEVRRLLEPAAAALAADRRDDADLRLLTAVVDSGVEAASPAAANRAHHRFLRAVATIARNDTLDTVLAPLHHRTLLAFVSFTFRVDPGGWDAHRTIRDAIATGDAERAHVLTRTHLDHVLAAVHAQGNLVPAVIDRHRPVGRA